jgi:hypothetical protein
MRVAIRSHCPPTDEVLEVVRECKCDSDVPDILAVTCTYLDGASHLFAAMEALGDLEMREWTHKCAATARQLRDLASKPTQVSVPRRSQFAKESQLRDFFATNLPTMPEHKRPLDPFSCDGRSGIEYQTDVGRIDILAAGDGALYVIELKLGVATDAALGQLLRYMGWVRVHLARGRAVFGIIVGASNRNFDGPKRVLAPVQYRCIKDRHRRRALARRYGATSLLDAVAIRLWSLVL